MTKLDCTNIKVPVPGMVIKEDTVFTPGIYDFSGCDGIIIGADNITIDGNGAVIKGGSIIRNSKDNAEENHEEFSYEKSKNRADNAIELGFYGIGVKSENFSGITLKNLTLSGFDIALHVKQGSNWTIENNDFSDNFTDPAWGWDEHGLHGGIIFEGVHESSIIANKATNVWDALHLRYSNKNNILKNNFSHVSDVCLKLWNSCGNIIEYNDLSYGIRIDPGEVHARDSSGVLIESGSNDNVFKRNDITYGGDGIFIRVLNGWMSTGNYFEENDCSYANNNAVEAWANGNTYVRNKANHSSYGFWLGGSDDTVMLENEVAYNGTNYRNAPEAFGNAGIAVVNGSSSHFKLINNYIHDNNGPGVAIRFNADYPAYHWIIEKNIIKNNRSLGSFKGHGIYIKNAQWLDIAANDISENEGEPIFIDSNVADVYLREASQADIAPKARTMVSDKTYTVGQEVIFDASESFSGNGQDLEYRWDLGDGNLYNSKVVSHIYEKPGFYRSGLTVNNGKLADLEFVNIHVTPIGEEIGTDKCVEQWKIESDDKEVSVTNDNEYFISGNGSIHVSARQGVNHVITYPKDKNLGLDLTNKNLMSFFLKFQTEADTDWNRSNKKPVVRLYESECNYIEYTPKTAYLEQLFVPVNEQKYEWKLIQFELDKPLDWDKCIVGKPRLQSINYIQFIEGPSTSAISDFWIDCLQFIEQPINTNSQLNIALNKYKAEYPKPINSYTGISSSEWAPLEGSNVFNGDATPRWCSVCEQHTSADDWYGVDFGVEREVNRLDIYFYNNPTRKIGEAYELTPESCEVEYWNKNEWVSVQGKVNQSDNTRANLNRFTFNAIFTSKIRVVLKHSKNASSAIYAFEAYNDANIQIHEALSSNTNLVSMKKAGLILNLEHNESGSQLSDLIVKLYSVKEDLTVCELLKEIKISKEQIDFGRETFIDMEYTGLQPNRRYALVLTQENLAKGRTEGDYYRWVAGGKRGYEYFGVYTDSSFKDETSTWGTAWLKVYTDKYIIDQSHSGEGLGNRLGLVGQEMRWQTFTIKDPLVTVYDGILTEGSGWLSNPEHSEDFIEFNLKERSSINKLNIYFYSNDCIIKLPKGYRVQYLNEGKWQNAVLENVAESICVGLSKVQFEAVTTDRVRIIFKNPDNASICVQEVEVIKA